MSYGLWNVKQYRQIINKKLVKPYFEILEQESGISGIYKAIERAGRLIYKSENIMPPYESTEHFIDILINAGCLSCLEHGTVYLKLSEDEGETNFWMMEGNRNTIINRSVWGEIERSFFRLLKEGWKPEQAKSELEKQDAQISEIMDSLYAEFVKRKFISKIE